MTKEDIKKASTLAIRDHYNCNGKYPCSERDYCQYNNGKNTAYDCNECGADEFLEGFLIAASIASSLAVKSITSPPSVPSRRVPYHFDPTNGTAPGRRLVSISFLPFSIY